MRLHSHQLHLVPQKYKIKREGHRVRFHATELLNLTTLLVCDGNFKYPRTAREAPITPRKLLPAMGQFEHLHASSETPETMILIVIP